MFLPRDSSVSQETYDELFSVLRMTDEEFELYFAEKYPQVGAGSARSTRGTRGFCTRARTAALSLHPAAASSRASIAAVPGALSTVASRARASIRRARAP